MHSTKCPKCGLVYLSTAANCKGCGTETATPEPAGYLAPTKVIPVAVPMAAVATSDKAQISRREQLLSTLKRDSFLFYYVGGVLMVLSFFVSYLLIPDAVLNVGLGYVAYRFQSRLAALTLLGLAILMILAGVYVVITQGPSLNFLTPLIMIFRVIAGIRIVRTTSELQSIATSELKPLFAPR